MSAPLFLTVWLFFTTITFCNAINSEHFPWERMLSFVDTRYSDPVHLRSLNRRTFRFYDPDYVAMHKLESIIYNLKDINDTVNYDYIWSLSKQIQLSSIGAIHKTFDRLDEFVCKHILKEQRTFYETPKARKLMHALGFQSISMHEYNALNLNDDEQIRRLNLSESGIKKLKLLLLASRGSENYLSAVLNTSSDGNVSGNVSGDVSQQSAVIQKRAYNEMSICYPITHNIVGNPVSIWSNFPWLAAPASPHFFTYVPVQTHLLYFDALYDFLWTRYHHEFGFPNFDSMFVRSVDDEELVKKVEFVKYIMDRYRLRIHEKFSESQEDTFRWMEGYVQQELQELNETNQAMLGATPEWINSLRLMWMNVRTAQRSLFWALTEALRLNQLLMPDDVVLIHQFMTEYVLAITEAGFLKISSKEEIPFVNQIIMELIDFNGPQEMQTTLRLREVLRVIEQSQIS